MRESGASLSYDSPLEANPNWQQLVANRAQTDRNWRECKFSTSIVNRAGVFGPFSAPGGCLMRTRDNDLELYAGDFKRLLARQHLFDLHQLCGIAVDFQSSPA